MTEKRTVLDHLRKIIYSEEGDYKAYLVLIREDFYASNSLSSFVVFYADPKHNQEQVEEEIKKEIKNNHQNASIVLVVSLFDLLNLTKGSQDDIGQENKN